MPLCAVSARSLVNVRMKGLLGNNHLDEGQSVEDGAQSSLVIVSNVTKNNTFTIVEADMEFPVLPFDDATIQFEGRAFWLRDLKRLQVTPETALRLDRSRMVINWLFSAQWASFGRNINVNDFTLIRIIDWTKVQWILILAIVQIRTEVHEGLLQANFAAEPLVIPDSPRVAVYFVHFVSGNATDLTLLNDFWVYPDHMFDQLKLFNGNLINLSKKLLFIGISSSLTIGCMPVTQFHSTIFLPAMSTTPSPTLPPGAMTHTSAMR